MNQKQWKRPVVVCSVLMALALTITMPAIGATTNSHPSAPLSVHASAGRGSARVSWSNPSSNGDSPITAYVVTSHPQEKSCTTSTTTCTISGLHNGSFTRQRQSEKHGGFGPRSRLSNRVRTKFLSATPTSPPKGGKTSWWKPGPGVLPWQWEIDHALDLSNATDMGTNDFCPMDNRLQRPRCTTLTASSIPPRR